jgi:SAM-dependent methyltransferase
VLAVDHNPERAALADWDGVQFQCVDLEHAVWPLTDVVADVVVVSNYLYRPRLPEVFALIAPGGLLVYETFGVGNEAYGRPSRAEFLLADGELAEVAPSDCQLLEAWFGLVELPKPAIRARACFQRHM